MPDSSRLSLRTFASACGLATLFLAGRCLAVDISASKYQGGATNAPYRTSNAPSLFPNPFKWMFGSPTSSAMKRVEAPPNFKVDLSIEPQQYTPSTNTPLRVRMTVHNQGKSKYILDFETAQRYEFVIRDKTGKDLYKASQDKEFTQVKSATVINRGEKLVFEEELFGGTNGAPVHLSPGAYTLIGSVTAKQTVSAARDFQVGP